MLTIRFQLLKRLSIDVSHNYFRDTPTFDLRLLGTGLLDQFLFQGFSGGFRLEVMRGITLYGSLGRSKREGDVSPALNYMAGLVLPRLPRLPHWLTLPRLRYVLPLPALPGLPALPSMAFRTDMRYSTFSSSFGHGSYGSVTLTRQFTDKLRLDLQAGVQTLSSPFTSQTRTVFGTSTLDYLIGSHYILGASWTLYHGGTQNYDQTSVNFGYRF